MLPQLRVTEVQVLMAGSFHYCKILSELNNRRLPKLVSSLAMMIHYNSFPHHFKFIWYSIMFITFSLLSFLYFSVSFPQHYICREKWWKTDGNTLGQYLAQFTGVVHTCMKLEQEPWITWSLYLSKYLDFAHFPNLDHLPYYKPHTCTCTSKNTLINNLITKI